ncbi:MAG: hypothetical protein SFV32_12755 [Opitutaceae bacterium]|nr:hypothetical protein [Opitutaceae bacterium]
MRYSSVVLEIWNRLTFHAQPQRMLEGLAIKRAGEWEMTGQSGFPYAALLEVSGSEFPSNSIATVGILLRSSVEHDFLRIPGAADRPYKGIIDWTELVMDAIETAPSTGKSDLFLLAHKASGEAVTINSQPIQLLPSELWQTFKIQEVSPIAYSMQIDINWKPAGTRRASRRSTPIPAPVEVQ